jgi:hypothetical protein
VPILFQIKPFWSLGLILVQHPTLVWWVPFSPTMLAFFFVIVYVALLLPLVVLLLLLAVVECSKIDFFFFFFLIIIRLSFALICLVDGFNCFLEHL